MTKRKPDVQFKKYKQSSIKAASDLGYDSDVKKKIDSAKTEHEITRIMQEARREKINRR